jgi:GAF domain-containing protein
LLGKTVNEMSTEPQIRNTSIPNHILERWQYLVDVMADVLTVPAALINRIDLPELEIFLANSSPDNPFSTGTRVPLDGQYCEKAIKNRQMVKVSDARRDPLWADSPEVEAGVLAYLGYPIFWPGGDIFGTICVLDFKGNEWGERYEKVILAFKEVVETHLALVQAMEQLEAKNQELHHTLGEVKKLSGLLPICANCKKIRDDKGYWNQVESYISSHSEVEFSHGICPECAQKLYPNFNNP